MAVFDGRFPWFPIPNHVTTDLDAKGKPTLPGLWARLGASEHALYPVLYILCNNKKHSAEVTNKQLRELTGLDKNFVRRAIDAVTTHRLFLMTPLDKRGQKYEVRALDCDGKPFNGLPVTLAVQHDRAAGRAMRRRKAPSTPDTEDTWGRI